jgi:transcriptional regulator with GAF, ATPase, and Fis domain
MPLLLQAKLLRVLEDNEVRPVGGTRPKRVDMRFIAATNQNLDGKVKSGLFRKDLSYRLAVVTIAVPPLRERIEDVPAIARHLLEQFGREMGKRRCYLDPSAMAELTACSWPGNARELRNVAERAVMLATSDVIIKAEIKTLLGTTRQVEPTGSGTSYAAYPIWKPKRRLSPISPAPTSEPSWPCSTDTSPRLPRPVGFQAALFSSDEALLLVLQEKRT